jgi:carbamoyltransferase
MMRILGLSFYYHDAAAVLLEDGVLVAAAQEERFSRRKHDPGFPAQAVAFCLRQGNCTADELDYVVFYEKPFLKFERLLTTVLATVPRSATLFREGMLTWLGDKLWLKQHIADRVGVPSNRILFIEHHHSHAASALFCSPYADAALLTVDGVGEWTTAAFGHGTAAWNGTGENRITLDAELRFPHSLGLLYSAFTAFLGFEVNEGEYKVMGMAPYGEPKYVDRVRRVVHVYDDGSLHLDLSYFTFPYHTRRTFGRKFEALFGEPRDPKARFVTDRTSRYDDPSPPTRAEIERNQYYADVAASIQAVTEDILLQMARHLHDRTGSRRLCLAGGVALNSVANFRILAETPFEELYIQPAAGDAGGALGAALYAYHVLLGQPRRFILEHAAWGESHDGSATADFLDRTGLAAEYHAGEDQLLDRVVDLLKGGKVVGWVQGRFEWGPRALGHRSILADPRRAEMKDIVNVKIKFREPFRPFAPSVIAEKVGDYFALPEPARHFPARYMLYVVPVKQPQVLPAITHADGTGRLQVVTRETNPRYHRLLERFGEATGVPVLLNTSFNLRGEPIVNTPADAYRTFMTSDMDALVLDNWVVMKEREKMR